MFLRMPRSLELKSYSQSFYSVIKKRQRVSTKAERESHVARPKIRSICISKRCKYHVFVFLKPKSSFSANTVGVQARLNHQCQPPRMP
ncbi:hypothetical protein ACN42_g2795 [Penicillium freii]|uniref:Uncharacterized protein n=1 Tax=Penicillium freii TaxID=48697 RepID=A0A101MPE3_PENFR|nr:hypothetical protein ACN42_g2795 [Penicillium freii]